MKKFNKFLSVAVASAMVMAMAGCGNTDNGSAATGTNAATESAASGSVFKIGGIGPTTGDAAIYGTAVMNGAQIAVDEINEAGGINGKKIEFNFQDDQSDAEKSVNAYNTLKDWGMQVLMGTVTTTPCVAVADKTAQDNMFEVTPSASSTDVIAGDNVFHALQTRTREQNLHSISVRTNWQRKLQSSTTVLMYIHQVLKQNSLKKQRIRDWR